MNPDNIIKKLLEKDKFSQWLGIEILQINSGYSKIQMKVREDMVNGFGIAHGGIAFSFADTAFAFACNSDGNITVALNVSVSFPKAIRVNDVLIAEAKEIHSTNKTGLFLIEVTNQNHELVCLFKGTSYKTEKNHEAHH